MRPLGPPGTLTRRRTDILAFFDHHASNGPTEAINGRLEALRRNALGFRLVKRSPTGHYVAVVVAVAPWVP